MAKQSIRHGRGCKPRPEQAKAFVGRCLPAANIKGLNAKPFVFILCCCLALATAVTPAGAVVTTRQIDGIRAKPVLRDEQDLALIDTFVKEQFLAMMRAPTPAGMVEPRRNLVAKTSGRSGSSYADRFAQAVQLGCREAFARAGEMTDSGLAEQLRLSAVLVLVDTDNPLLLDDLLRLTEDKAATIRYWALSGLTTDAMFSFLSASGANSSTLRSLVAQLDTVVQHESNGLVIAKIAAASRLFRANDAKATADLLHKCVQRRLLQYRNWTVQHEISDLETLRQLFTLIAANPFAEDETTGKDIVLQAAELISAAYYRYTMGSDFQVGPSQTVTLLGQSSRRELRSLLIESELGLYASITGTNRKSLFFRAIRAARRPGEIASAYNDLLGPEGLVNRTFDLFPENKKASEPPLQRLPDPSAEVIRRMQNVREVQIPGRTLQTPTQP